MTLTDADLDRIEAESRAKMDRDYGDYIPDWFPLTMGDLIAEIRRLRAAQITTLVPCSRCGRGQRLRNMVAMGDERLCVDCAEVEMHRFRAALSEIRGYGAVCPEFETCDHVSCRDSYSAWQVAGNALYTDTGELRYPIGDELTERIHEIRRLRTALQQIARVEPGLAALPGVAKRVLDGEE